MRCQEGKGQRTTGQMRRTGGYGNATYDVSQRKGLIERECMRSGKTGSEGTATYVTRGNRERRTLVRGTWDGDNQAEHWRTEQQGYRSGTSSLNSNWRRVNLIVWNRKRWQNILWRLEWYWTGEYRGDTRGTERRRWQHCSNRIIWDKRRRGVTREESHWRTASYNI